MTGEVVAFYCLSTVLVGSALATVLTKNLFHAVLWLALALTGTAGVFLLLDAEFLAAVQLLLYAGGIVTIVVFAIVVTERLVGERIRPDEPPHRRWRGGVHRARVADRERCDAAPTRDREGADGGGPDPADR